MNVKVNEKIKFVPVCIEPNRYAAGTVFLFGSGKTACILVDNYGDRSTLISLQDGSVYHEFDNDYELPTPQDVDRELGEEFMVLERGKVTLTISVED